MEKSDRNFNNMLETGHYNVFIYPNFQKNRCRRMQKVQKVRMLHQVDFLHYASLEILKRLCPAESCYGHCIPKVFYFVFPVVNQHGD